MMRTLDRLSGTAFGTCDTVSTSQQAVTKQRLDEHGSTRPTLTPPIAQKGNGPLTRPPIRFHLLRHQPTTR